MIMAGLELAAALIVVVVNALTLLVEGFESNRMDSESDIGFYWTTEVLGTVHVLYDVGLNTALIVWLCCFEGPSRHHEHETKRVGTPLHRKYVIVFTVLLAIAMALMAVMLSVGFAWRLDSKKYGTTISYVILGLLLDFGWYVVIGVVGVRPRRPLHAWCERDIAPATQAIARLHAAASPPPPPVALSLSLSFSLSLSLFLSLSPPLSLSLSLTHIEYTSNIPPTATYALVQERRDNHGALAALVRREEGRVVQRDARR